MKTTDKITVIRTEEELAANKPLGFRYTAEGKSTSTYKTIAGIKRAWGKLQQPGGGCEGLEPVVVDLSIGGWHQTSGFALFLRDKA